MSPQNSTDVSNPQDEPSTGILFPTRRYRGSLSPTSLATEGYNAGPSSSWKKKALAVANCVFLIYLLLDRNDRDFHNMCLRLLAAAHIIAFFIRRFKVAGEQENEPRAYVSAATLASECCEGGDEEAGAVYSAEKGFDDPVLADG